MYLIFIRANEALNSRWYTYRQTVIPASLLPLCLIFIFSLFNFGPPLEFKIHFILFSKFLDVHCNILFSTYPLTYCYFFIEMKTDL